MGVRWELSAADGTMWRAAAQHYGFSSVPGLHGSWIPGLGSKNDSNSKEDIYCGLLNLKVLLLGGETLECKELVVKR